MSPDATAFVRQMSKHIKRNTKMHAYLKEKSKEDIAGNVRMSEHLKT